MTPRLHPPRQLLPLPDNRVWRTYTGGRLLDEIQSIVKPADTHFPEDWIASTTRAINPGRDEPEEGLSTVITPEGKFLLANLIAADLTGWLGETHVDRYGSKGMILVKFLDAAVRLHVQAHPTVPFAQARLGANSGKSEAYVILRTRPEQAQPYIFLGFQRPPNREEFRRILEQQDIAAMEACFERIPVKPGDAFYVPGGLPHAIGEGVLMVEIMEPTDFVVRLEFEKAGCNSAWPAPIISKAPINASATVRSSSLMTPINTSRTPTCGTKAASITSS